MGGGRGGERMLRGAVRRGERGRLLGRRVDAGPGAGEGFGKGLLAVSRYDEALATLPMADAILLVADGRRNTAANMAEAQRLPH